MDEVLKVIPTIDKIFYDLNCCLKEFKSRCLYQHIEWATSILTVIQNTSKNINHELQHDNILTNYCLEKAYNHFHQKEYDRSLCYAQQVQTPVGIFMDFYSRFMIIEKKCFEKATKFTEVQMSRKELMKDKAYSELHEELEEIEMSKKDSYLLYLLAVLNLRAGSVNESIENLSSSLNFNNSNYASWSLLSEILNSNVTYKISSLNLPNCWMKMFFYLKLANQNLFTDEILTKIPSFIRESTVFISTLAVKLTNHKKYKMARYYFEKLLEIDHGFTDYMGFYSDILFVEMDTLSLVNLAKRMQQSAKHKADTYFVLANLYSAIGQHDKAVAHLKVLLKLNPFSTRAWIVLGHEYIQLMNTVAAINAYHNALEINPVDFISCHSLGYVYELLKQPSLALHFYQKALVIQPDNADVLVALGNVLENLSDISYAKICYRKALEFGDSENIGLIRLSHLLEEDDKDEAAKLYTKFLVEIDANNGLAKPNDASQAAKFLMNYHYNQKNYNEAEVYARKAFRYNQSRHEAQIILSLIDQSDRQNIKMDMSIVDGSDMDISLS